MTNLMTAASDLLRGAGPAYDRSERVLTRARTLKTSEELQCAIDCAGGKVVVEARPL